VTAVTSEQGAVMENVEKSAMELKVKAEKLNRTITR
jgi:methyl-accepting chemotaxis protein